MAFTTLKELEGRPDMEWLIDGILPKGKVCAVWGDTEAGKSFLMVDWAGVCGERYPVARASCERAWSGGLHPDRRRCRRVPETLRGLAASIWPTL